MAKILVADSDPMALQVMKTLLESDGHEVSEVRTGAFALHMMKRSLFDLVILNYEINDMDSDEMLGVLRLLPKVPKVLMVSRAEIPDDTRASFEMLEMPYLQKLSTLQPVRVMVRSLLGQEAV